MTLYNKARNDQWEESDVCMSIIARFGTGGNNIPIVMEEIDNDQLVCGQWTDAQHRASANVRNSELYA